MEKILGTDVGTFIRQLHEQHGVTFHLGTTAASIDERGVTLETGEYLPADFVVIGIGVRPAILLAEQAGLTIDRGITLDQYLEARIPGIFAAGDIARWPDRLTGERIRVPARSNGRGAITRPAASGARSRRASATSAACMPATTSANSAGSPDSR